MNNDHFTDCSFADWLTSGLRVVIYPFQFNIGQVLDLLLQQLPLDQLRLKIVTYTPIEIKQTLAKKLAKDHVLYPGQLSWEELRQSLTDTDLVLIDDLTSWLSQDLLQGPLLQKCVCLTSHLHSYHALTQLRQQVTLTDRQIISLPTQQLRLAFQLDKPDLALLQHRLIMAETGKAVILVNWSQDLTELATILRTNLINSLPVSEDKLIVISHQLPVKDRKDLVTKFNKLDQAILLTNLLPQRELEGVTDLHFHQVARYELVLGLLKMLLRTYSFRTSPYRQGKVRLNFYLTTEQEVDYQRLLAIDNLNQDFQVSLGNCPQLITQANDWLVRVED